MDNREDFEAEKFDAFLAARQKGEGSAHPTQVDPGEAKLTDDLLDLSAAAKPSAEFVQMLSRRLASEAHQRIEIRPEQKSLQIKWSLALRFILVGAVTVILALVAYFSLEQPKPSEAARLPSLNGSAQGGGGAENLFPGVEFILQTSLPDVPASVPVYQQPVPNELDTSQVRDLATRFGFTGAIYVQKWPDQGGFPALPTSYTLFDGQRRLQITNQSIQFNDYSIPNSVWLQPALPFDQVTAIARQFLTNRGLLDSPYHVAQGLYSASLVDFEILAGQWPVASLVASVVVTPEGRVASVYYPLTNLKTLDEYPIHPASEAWAALQGGTMPGRWTETTVSGPVGGPHPGPSEIWGQEYAPIQYVEITSSVSVYMPAAGENAQPRLDLGSGNPRLEVAPQDVQGLIDTNYNLVLLWGQIRADADGSLVFQVAGWKDAAGIQMQNLQGVIVRQAGDVLLRQADGQEFLLPLAPRDLPDGTAVSVMAWNTNRTQDGYPVLGWNEIDTPPQPPATVNPPAAGGAQPTVESGTSASTPEPSSGAVTVVVSTQVAPETALPGSQPPGLTLAGKAYIDKVELIYVVTPGDPDARSLSESIIQPAWRFSGHMDNGNTFEILFQAVYEKYLE